MVTVSFQDGKCEHRPSLHITRCKRHVAPFCQPHAFVRDTNTANLTAKLLFNTVTTKTCTSAFADSSADLNVLACSLLSTQTLKQCVPGQDVRRHSIHKTLNLTILVVNQVEQPPRCIVLQFGSFSSFCQQGPAGDSIGFCIEALPLCRAVL